MDSRLGLDALSYPVPRHANTVFYTLGGITLFGLVVLIGSGIYLAQFYNPQPVGAHESVGYIIQSVRFGALVRSIHFWMANLVMITMLLHMARVFATGSYQKPRELNWLVGLALFGTSLGLVFTGTVLKWDQEGYEALGHNEGMGKLLGGLGTWFTAGFTRSVPILSRLFIAHVAILPAILILFVIGHFALVKHHGISGLPGQEAEGDMSDTQVAIVEEGRSSFASHLRHLVGWGLLVTAAAGALSLLFGSPLGPLAAAGPERTKPPWMFLPFFSLENLFGLKSLLWAPVILFLLLALVPLVDRSPAKALRGRRPILAAGTVLAVALIGLAVLALTTAAKTHLGGM
ncbi:MAG: cytochrome b N-terminal domain-containing protein [Actinobacteria bacterium]|nr:cytochrome b N-terminal domain-containing protein [Actinomycetota bacterium]